MTTGDKIQDLRAKNYLSQEQLAEKIAVSRQAISKWELNQSKPDTEYIIKLSNIFGVSTDYLLKDEIENNASECISSFAESKIPDSSAKISSISFNVIVLVATAIVVIGLILALGISYDRSILYTRFDKAFWGLIVQIIGILVFEFFSIKNSGSFKPNKKYLFYGINIWFLMAVPSIFMAFPTMLIIDRFLDFIPYNVNGFLVDYFPGKFLGFSLTVVYLLIALLISGFCLLMYNKNRRTS